MKYLPKLIVFFIAHLSLNAQQTNEENYLIEDIGPTIKEGPTDIFVSVEQMPEFPGGKTKFNEFVSKKLKYPKHARENNIQGTVFLTFVVEKDGKLTDIKVLRGINEELNNEAIKVVKSMPKWNPGKQNGKPVRVQYNVPIKFILKNIEK